LQMDHWQPETEQITTHHSPEAESPSKSPARLDPAKNRATAVETPQPVSPATFSPPRNQAAPGFAIAQPVQDIASLIHDARNMVSAMDLYCDLLAEPEVLSAPFRHYAGELRLIGNACRRLLEKMADRESTSELKADSRADSHPSPDRQPESSSNFSQLPSKVPQGSGTGSPTTPAFNSTPASLIRSKRRHFPLEGQPVENLAEELLANQNILSALVGPGIAISLSIHGGQQPISMTRDDLTRVMVNLVRNAAEAMPRGGQIQIELKNEAGFLSLSVEDSGTGIPEESLEKIFLAGYSTHPITIYGLDSSSNPAASAWPVRHRGLGLSIVRSIVSAAGGTVRAFNRVDDPTVAGSPGITGKPHATLPAAADRNPEVLGAVILIEFPRHGPPVASS
jgi:signal transduction histidine kinase